MSNNAEKIKETISRAGKTTANFIETSAKWVQDVSCTLWGIGNNYVDMKLKQSKIRGQFTNLGKEAYRQYKDKSEISLTENLKRIKETEAEISQGADKISSLVTNLNTLFTTNKDIAQKPKPSPAKSASAQKTAETSPAPQQKTPEKPAPAKKAVSSPVKKSSTTQKTTTAPKSNTVKKAAPKKPAEKKTNTKPSTKEAQEKPVASKTQSSVPKETSSGDKGTATPQE
ncbi:MAG: hypothetical protein AB1454_08835 [Candidatus Auribacterota bacterium]